jgi:hypothetical protein
MSRIIERAPVPMAPEAKVEGLKMESEIERPYGMSFVLGLDRNAIMIDDQVIIGYKNTFLSQFTYPTRELHISRELTQPIKVEQNGTEVCIPHRNEDRLKGEFGTLFIGLRPQKPVCYIGKNIN